MDMSDKPPFDAKEESLIKEMLLPRVDMPTRKQTEASLAALHSAVPDATILPRTRVWSYTSIAAALIIIAVGIKYVPNFIKQSPQVYTYSTGNAQRASVTLPDGSVAVLAPATVLKVSNRNVELQGEAVFTVNQHNGDPFVVKSGRTITRVLGTIFGVRAYDQNVRVMVQDGRVAVDTMVLGAGDVGVMNAGALTVIHNLDVTSMLSWTAGRLALTNQSLRDVLPDLERWYDAKIVVADTKLMNEKLEGALPTGTVADLAQVLEMTLNARVTRSGRILTLQAK